MDDREKNGTALASTRRTALRGLVLLFAVLGGPLACSGGGDGGGPTAPTGGGGGSANLAGSWAGLLTHPSGRASDADFSLRVESVGADRYQVAAASVEGTAVVLEAHDPNQTFPCSPFASLRLTSSPAATAIDPVDRTFTVEFLQSSAANYSKPSRFVLSGRFTSGTRAEGELTMESFAGNTYIGPGQNNGASVCPSGGGVGRSVWVANKR